jgi:threonylcarbamoyladenosine tRNA methylthiotransferase MtaB
VVLTGIHLSSYGLDCPESGITLIDIIERINEINGIERIRLGSLEPMIVTEEFTERLSKCNKVCPHFHLSLQSGCNDTLKRMNRRYTVEEFKNCVDILRRYFDNPAITTDVIVGFPGETEEEFAQTERFLEDVRFYEMHIFKYSRRKGTVADKMPNQIPEAIKTARSNVLFEMDARLTGEYRKSYAGHTVPVLFEENIIIDGKQYIIGFTDTYVRVALENEMDEYLPNNIYNVKITDTIIKDMVIGVAEI